MKNKTIVKIDLNDKRYGGRIYENEIVNCLSDQFNFKRVFLLKYKCKIFNLVRIIGLYLYYRYFFKGYLMLTNHTTWMAGCRSKNLVIVHHIDTSTSRGLSGLFQKLCDKALTYNINRYHYIITVSSYWKNILLNLGFSNPIVIYNSFDPSLYTFTADEINDFKNRFDLNGKPIIYLGNSQRQKGVVESYSSLKELNCYFVTSGIKDVELPVKHLDLDFRDYRILLNASNVVICMSKLIEGWNRTAHEAMLSGTPVIGSGTGGMRELLDIGEGYICKDFSDLRLLVKDVFAKNIKPNSNNLSKYNIAYFVNSWSQVLDAFVNSKDLESTSLL